MPEAPVGAIKFMIQADSLNTSFEQAINDALDDINIDASDITDTIEDAVSNVDIGGDDIDYIKNAVDDIRQNLLTRLRTTIDPRNKAGTLLALQGEIKQAKEESTKEKLTEAMSSGTGADLVPEGVPTEEMAERYQERYVEVMSQFLKSGSWKSNIRRIQTWKGMFEDFVSGRHEYRGKDLFEQMTKETEYEKKLRKKLKSEYGIETLPQKTWAGIRKDIKIEGKEEKDIIDNTEKTLEVIEDIGKELTDDDEDFKKAMSEIFGTTEVRGEGLAGKIIDKFWERYGVKEQTKVLPRPMMKRLPEEEQEESFYSATLLGRRFDLPQYISKESIKEGGWRELLEEQDAKDIADKIEKVIKERDVPGVMSLGILKTLFKESDLTKRGVEVGAKDPESYRYQTFAKGGKAVVALRTEGEEPLTNKKLEEAIDDYMEKRDDKFIDLLDKALNRQMDMALSKEELNKLKKKIDQIRGNDY